MEQVHNNMKKLVFIKE